MTPEMEPVASTNVAAIGYDADAEEIYVEFIGGRTYAYGLASHPLWLDFEAAGSKGTFVNNVLKLGYPCRPV
jgi:hypothetical protein